MRFIPTRLCHWYVLLTMPRHLWFGPHSCWSRSAPSQNPNFSIVCGTQDTNNMWSRLCSGAKVNFLAVLVVQQIAWGTPLQNFFFTPQTEVCFEMKLSYISLIPRPPLSAHNFCVWLSISRVKWGEGLVYFVTRANASGKHCGICLG